MDDERNSESRQEVSEKWGREEERNKKTGRHSFHTHTHPRSFNSFTVQPIWIGYLARNLSLTRFDWGIGACFPPLGAREIELPLARWAKLLHLRGSQWLELPLRKVQVIQGLLFQAQRPRMLLSRWTQGHERGDITVLYAQLGRQRKSEGLRTVHDQGHICCSHYYPRGLSCPLSASFPLLLTLSSL